MTLKWFDDAAAMLAVGENVPAINVFPVYSGPFALVNDAMLDPVTPGPRQDLELASARIYKVMSGTDSYAVVVLCRIKDEKPQWAFYCGDKQLDGTHRVDGKTLAAKVRTEGKVSNGVANTLEASEWVAKVPGQNNCGFYKMMERGEKMSPPRVITCSHAKAVLQNLPAAEPEVMADELKDWLSGAAVSVTAAMGPLSPEEEAFYDAAFIQHVMLAGERGAGKTYLARKAADQYDAVYLELQMHPSMEAWELRAHDRAWNGKVYTVLGKLAEAVYWIQQGKKVVLCMDEFLNMNPMYTTAINTPLSLTANDTYIIETGKIIDMGEGIGRIETVEVPADKFWVVATSNIGARYNLDKIAPSVRARFQIILMNTNAERTRSIVESTLGKYGMPLEFGEMFKKFIETVNQGVAENKLDEEATTRLACNVIRAVHLKALRDKKRYATLGAWLPVVKKQLLNEIAQVVNFELGPLDADQEEYFKTIVDTAFKAPK